MADKSILLVHNLPPGTEFGIDYSSWYIGPRFCGLNAIPNGFHFVFTSSVDKNLQHSPRNGQFLFFDGKDEETDVFFEASWNETNEELGIFKKYQDTIPENEADFLSPYPCDEKFETWKKLTSFITKETLTRVCPNCNRISPTTLVDCTAELEKKERLKLGLKEAESELSDLVKIRFTKIPEQKFPDDAKPEDITKCSLDNSFALESMFLKMNSNNCEDEILAEIQFAFVCFMIGQVFDAFEHWKTLIRLICKCDDALSNRPAFFIKFLDVMEIQIKEIPQDFFVDIVAEQNFLVQTFQILFSTLRESDNVDRRLAMKSEHLKQQLANAFDWTFDFDDEEDLPVVVDVN